MAVGVRSLLGGVNELPFLERDGKIPAPERRFQDGHWVGAPKRRDQDGYFVGASTSTGKGINVLRVQSMG